MGDHYPVLPAGPLLRQARRTAAGRRINVIAGLTGAEAILTGLAGMRPHPDGSLCINPHPVASGTISLSGLTYRDHTIDVQIAPDHTEITVDGRRLSPGAAARAVPPR